MANLKEIRSRISSASSTIQIIGAMKMISTVKLREVQDAIITMKPYAYELKQPLEHLSSALGSKSIYNPRKGAVRRVLLMVTTSNRSLCGIFNANAVKKVTELTQTIYKDKEVQYYTIDKKGNNVLKKIDKMLDNNNHISDKLTFASAASLAETLMTHHISGEFDQIVLVYSSLKSAAIQTLTEETFLPIQPVITDKEATVNYPYESPKQEIVTQLIPRSPRMQLFKALRDSVATEHGACTTAIHKATDNVQDLRNESILTYSKARQAIIVGEVIKIVGGSEALSQKRIGKAERRLIKKR